MGLVGALHAFFVDSEPSQDHVPARTYRCTECDNEVRVDSDQSPPRCICKSNSWKPLEAVQDPVVVRQ